MSTLIVILSTEPAGAAPEYEFVFDDAGMQPAAHGRCPPAMLPAPVKPSPEVVALVPARALTWLQVRLPHTVGRSLLRRQADPQRLRAVLAGLLEEQLLDEPDQLHFAVFPGVNPETPAWVAVCNRTWLHASLQALDAAGRHATRIVPEFAPLTASAPPRACLTTGLAPAELVLCTAAGVTALPLGPVAVSLAQQAGALELLAEPAVAEAAEQMFGQTVTLQTDAQRRLQAGVDSPWNLAQFDLAPSRQTRLLKALSQGWRTLARSAPWRPMRWSLLALLFIHVLGLNALAWKQQAELDGMQTAIRHLLVQTFPHVAVIVDPPLQMERELAALQQATGQTGDRGLAEALMQLALVAPHYQPLDALELDAGSVLLKGPPLAPEELDALAGRLNALGWSARRQDERLVMALRTTQP